MRRFLLAISIIIYLFSLPQKAGAQSNQTVNNGGATTTANFPGTGCVYNWVNDTPGIGLAASGAGNIPSFTAVNTGTTPVTATITATPVPTGYAYITNAGSNTVSVINTATNVVTATLTVGINPRGVTVSPDGSRAYITNPGDGTVSVINTATNTVISTIQVASGTAFLIGLSISPDGSKLYVAGSGSNSVYVVNTLTNTVVANVAVGLAPTALCISPDGSTLYVTNYTSNTVSVISTTANTLVANISAGSNPYGVCISPDGGLLYVANYGSNTVSVINTTTNILVSEISVGSNPVGVSVSPDGSRLYVTNTQSGNISVINTATNAVIFNIAVGSGPFGVSVSPDGNRVYVINENSGDVSVINTATNSVIATVNVGAAPASLGNFVTGGTGCISATFTITVNPSPASSSPIKVTGNISACAGSPSASPYIQQFIISGNNLLGNITATAPINFEVSLSAGSGYGNSVMISETGGTISNTIVYVRSAASAPTGNIVGNVILTSTGAANQNVPVTGVVNALPTVNVVPDQTVINGIATAAVNFTGTGNTFNWVNDTPGIGLAATGSGNIASFTAVNTGSVAVTANITAIPSSSGYAYIGGGGSKDVVTVVNVLDNSTVATIPVGSSPPFGLVISQDNSRVYVSNSLSSSISVVSTSTNSVVATILTGTNVGALAISPDGNFLYAVTLTNVLVINTNTNNVIGTIVTGPAPYGIAISPDGSLLYVASFNSNNISLISTSNFSTLTIIASNTPRVVTISPDGSRLYVSELQNNAVEVINTQTNAIIANIPVGSDPLCIAVSPDGSKAYVSNQNSNTVSVINTQTNQVIATVNVGIAPFGISITSDGSKVYVENFVSGTVSVIDATSNTVIDSLSVSAIPFTVGNFISNGTSCTGTPVKFTITVNPTPSSPPTITASTVTGNISSCIGTASASPQIQQFTVSGSSLSGNIIATAPTGFEVSLSAGSGYGNSVTVPETGDTLSNTIVYVRSAASAPIGNIVGNVILTSTGAASQNVPVTGTVNALPTVSAIPDQTLINGTATAAVNFTGTGNTFNWVNDTPGIGLAANGSGNIASFTAVNTGSSPVIATITVTPTSSGYAYIANGGSNNVSVINTTTNAVVATIPVGTSPFGVAVSPDGSRVYVTNQGSANISVINTATNTVVATIAVGVGPFGVAVSPDGSLVYVTNQSSNTVSVINTAANSVVSSISSGNIPNGVLVSPDGSKLYVANNGSGTVTVFNTNTNGVLGIIPVGNAPAGLAESPDGSTLYVTNNLSNSVSVINAATRAVVATIPVNLNPYGIAVTPDGSRLYVADVSDASISVINTATNTVISTIADNSPTAVSVSPDGSSVYVTSQAANSVSVINTATNLITGTINTSTGPISFGNFVAGGTGCSGVPVKFTITVNPTLPTDIITTGTLSALNTTYGTASASTTFNVSGTNTAAGILVTPPAGFEVSTDNITFNSTVVVGAAGTIPLTLVYIRLAATTPVGNYSGNIILSSAGASNVNIAMPNSIVNPTPLTITADNKIKNYLQANPILTVTYSGFVNNDGPAQLIVQPIVTTTAITTSLAGQYPITASGAISDNYTFIYVPGVLTINPGEQIIVIPNAFTPNGDGINDTWDIKNLDSYLNCTVQVYNRYGENVYSSIGYGIPWDGRYRGAGLPTGTYYYIINLKKDLKVLSGFVAIIR